MVAGREPVWEAAPVADDGPLLVTGAELLLTTAEEEETTEDAADEEAGAAEVEGLTMVLLLFDKVRLCSTG